MCTFVTPVVFSFDFLTLTRPFFTARTIWMALLLPNARPKAVEVMVQQTRGMRVLAEREKKQSEENRGKARKSSSPTGRVRKKKKGTGKRLSRKSSKKKINARPS